MMAKSKPSYKDDSFWDGLASDISDSKSNGTIDNHIERYLEEYRNEIPDFLEKLTKKANELSRPERGMFYKEENFTKEQIQEMEELFSVSVKDSSDIKYEVEHWIVITFSGFIRYHKKNPKATRYTWLWFRLLGMEDPCPPGTILTTRERLYILFLLQKHKYLNNMDLLVNKKEQIFFLSQLLDIRPKNFGNELSDLSLTFKVPSNANIQWYTEKIKSLKNLEMVLDNSLYVTAYIEISDLLKDFEEKRDKLKKTK